MYWPMLSPEKSANSLRRSERSAMDTARPPRWSLPVPAWAMSPPVKLRVGADSLRISR